MDEDIAFQYVHVRDRLLTLILSEALDIHKIYGNKKNVTAADIDKKHPLLNSGFIEIFILLRDLLYKSEKYGGKRINFDDHITKTHYIHDITDLITECRNAVCHVDSDKSKRGRIGDVYMFNYLVGVNTIVDDKGNVLLTSIYPDDFAINIAEHVVYYRHHMIRAFYEAHSVLEPKLHEYIRRSNAIKQ